jgi:lysophospholipase L1-like esterase
MRRLSLLLSLGGALAAALAFAMPADAAIAYPNSMASTGDSITRAFDSTWNGCVLVSCPQYSWSTGSSSTVNSQYLRLVALNPQLSGNAYNDAKVGANMSLLDGQMKTAAAQGAEYVTVLMGANDACTSSIATMTPTRTFAIEFNQALTDFFAAEPNAHVYLSSVPNIYWLWSILHTNRAARTAWATYRICQSMLSDTNTEVQRQQVLAQVQAYNRALPYVCSAFPNCRWDNLAGYNFQFTPDMISTIDYFHPNVTGQAAIAGVTWAASYWGG